MKPSALVKIASQCAEFYQEAQKQLHKDSVRGLFDKVVFTGVLQACVPCEDECSVNYRVLRCWDTRH